MLPERYTVSARAYDLLSGERPIYRRGRVAGIAALRLAPGQSVLDLGCGTGLNHPLLVEAVGDGGSVLGLDRSAQMLAQARRRAQRRGWPQVRTEQADMVDGPAQQGFDAVLATYALSLVPDWPTAWVRALAAVRPGGRVAVVDLALPAHRVWQPLARLACALGGADPQAHPWTALERDCTDVTSKSLWDGHVEVRVGTR